MTTYKDIETIAAYNRQNKTNFYTLEQVQEHQKKMQELAQAKAVASNPDVEDARDAYISALNPQTVENVDKIRKWDEDAKATNAIGLAAAAALPEMVTYGALPGFLSYASGTAASIGGGYLGGKAGEYADNKFSTSIFKPVGQFVGGLTGYGLGSGIVNKTAPYQILKLKREMPDHFGSSHPLTEASNTKVNWHYKKGGAGYQNNTIYSRLYPNASTIGHEFGHHVSFNYPGLKKGNVLGAFTEGYEYAPGIDPELNYAENFADWFRTAVKRPYSGKDVNLSTRQKVINDGFDNTKFFSVTNPGFVGEKPLTVAERLLEKEIKIVPLTSKSKLLFSKGNPTGSEIFAERYDGRPLNWSNINYDIESGKNDAIRYLASPRKMRTDLHNKAIAKRLFNVDIHPQTDPAIRASVPMELTSTPLLKGTWHPKYGVRLTFDPKSTTKGNTIFDFKDPKFDEISLDLSSDLNDSALHEWLHRGNVGGGDNITRAFYKWKVQKLLKPGYTGYLETPEETGVNFIELGRRNGIINKPYPGFNEAKERINQIIHTDPNKGYLLNDTVWETKPKRVWDALQGKYIGLVPISIAATSMINDNENE